jgi:alanine racemase
MEDSNMKIVDRREFVALAGTAPLGLAWSANRQHVAVPAGAPDDLFDPWLEINTANVAWNVSQVRKRVGNRPILAVIKCNAYGHGIVEFAGLLEKQGIKDFAVVKVQEALALREGGIKGMILNFGPFSGKDADQLVQHGISQSVFSDAVDLLADAARKSGKRAKVHIKVDTGLARVGVPHKTAVPFVEKIASMPGILIEGIFTTLTEELDFDPIQIQRLLQVHDTAKGKGISTGIRHAASSAAVANFPGAFLDMVRPGNCLYGLEALPNLNLRPAMSLKTRVLYVKKMAAGETLSYHRQYTLPKDATIATLPLGYSDGYPYRGVNKADVLIRGRRWPLIGYMSANHATVDITGAEDIGIGDEVVLYGRQEGDEITIAEVSQWGDSSVYKVVIGMNPLVPRIYIE